MGWMQQHEWYGQNTGFWISYHLRSDVDVALWCTVLNGAEFVMRESLLWNSHLTRTLITWDCLKSRKTPCKTHPVLLQYHTSVDLVFPVLTYLLGERKQSTQQKVSGQFHGGSQIRSEWSRVWTWDNMSSDVYVCVICRDHFLFVL